MGVLGAPEVWRIRILIITLIFPAQGFLKLLGNDDQLINIRNNSRRQVAPPSLID